VKVAPRPWEPTAHKRPPWDSIIERQMRSPTPVPWAFVVKNGSKICPTSCGGSPRGVTDRKKNRRVLGVRREILESTVKAYAHVGISQESSRTANEMLAFVNSHSLEGIIAKRSNSVYEPGRGSGISLTRNLATVPSFVPTKVI
jgi:hypothetical protein